MKSQTVDRITQVLQNTNNLQNIDNFKNQFFKIKVIFIKFTKIIQNKYEYKNDTKTEQFEFNNDHNKEICICVIFAIFIRE